jgi:hypothetical protein
MDAEAMRGTARAFRDRLSDVARHCEQILAQAGARLNPAQTRRLGETVRAAIGGDRTLRERLLSGRLTEDIAIENPFGDVEASPTGGAGAPRAKQAQLSAAKAREREAEKARAARASAIEEAKRQVNILEEEARQARATARQTEASASRAQAEADRARVALAAVEDRLAKARQALQRL